MAAYVVIRIKTDNPTFDDAQNYYHSDEYTAAKTLRQDVAEAEIIAVDGIK